MMIKIRISKEIQETSADIEQRLFDTIGDRITYNLHERVYDRPFLQELMDMKELLIDATSAELNDQFKSVYNHTRFNYFGYIGREPEDNLYDMDLELPTYYDLYEQEVIKRDDFYTDGGDNSLYSRGITQRPESLADISEQRSQIIRREEFYEVS
jgi:hypothetical protein